jgi:ABC-type dipeptide/oligopeptide/nickel transport system permease component
MQGVLPYIVRRLAWAPFILLVVSLITFALGRFGPGDPVRILAGQHPNPQVIERIRHEKGLDDPFFVQYGRYMWNAFHGDFGESFKYQGQPIKDVVYPRLWVTFQYNLLAFILVFAIGIPVGIWAALRQGTWQDPMTMGTFLFFASIPVLIMVPVLQYIFALNLRWLPSGGWEFREFFGFLELGLFSKTIIIPTVALTLPGVAGVARLMRAQVLEVVDQDYVRGARAKGLPEFTVIFRHVARNALLPITTIMGFALVGLLSGSIFLETLLGIPGIGRYAFEAVGARDYDGIMAIVLIVATAFIVANLLVDIIYGFIDPRVRVGREGH